jgi:hypothetical protein
LQDRAGSSRMCWLRSLKREELIQPKRIGHDLREAAERRCQMLKAPEKLNEVLQGDFTDYVTKDGEKCRKGCITKYLSRLTWSPSVGYRDPLGFDRCHGSGAHLRTAAHQPGYRTPASVYLTKDGS